MNKITCLFLTAWLTCSQVAYGVLRPEFVLLDNPNATPELEHHWKCDENAASTAVLDRITDNSGSAVDNTQDDDAALGAVWQATGLYAGWDGVVGTIVNEPITLATAPGATATADELTVALYVLAPKPGSDAILSVSDRSTGYAWEMGSGTTGGITSQQFEVRTTYDGMTINKRFRTVDTVFANVNQTSFPTGCVWVHLAFTYSASNQRVRLYVNGRLEETTSVSSGSWGIFDSTADLVVGNHDGGDADSQCPCAVADVRIYSRELTDREIQAIASRHHLYIDPTCDTYYGVIPNGDDIYAATQVAIDTAGSSINHATLHRLNEIRFPHGAWEVTQAIVCPNTSAQGMKISAVGRSDSSSSEVRTTLTRSSSWTGDSIGIIEVRGQGWQIEDIAFVGNSDTEGAQAGVGVHLTRGPSESGNAPSTCTVRRCKGTRLLALGKAGWDTEENNCDFFSLIDCSIDDCSYALHNRNEQGQMQRVEGIVGEPTAATVYAERGGPIWITRFGSAGSVPVLLIGTPGAQQSHFVLSHFKFDAQADVDTKIVEMEEDGPAHVVVENGFITNGERGNFGTNFVMQGQSQLIVRNVIGPGKTACTAGTGTNENPSVLYDACKFCWGDDSPSSAQSPAKLVDANPSVLITGTATLNVTNCIAGSRFDTGGSISPNPKRIQDYRQGRAIGVTINPGE